MSKEPEFAVFPLDWVRHPKCRKLRQADPANPDRWWVLMTLATTCRAGGRLAASDGTPLTAEDFAWEHDRQDEAWAAFIDLAKKLRLLSADQDGTLFVVPWPSWNRDAARAEKTQEESYRKKAQRERERREALEQELATVRGQMSHPCPTDVPDLSRVSHLEEKRDEETLPEETQIDRKEMSAEAQICLADFSEIDFLSVADDQHRLLKGKKLSGPDRTALKKTVSGADWAGKAWGDRAAALVLAVDRTRHRIESKKLDREGNTWFYALQSAPGFFELAEQINIQNRIMIQLGEPFMALEAGP